MKKPICVLNSLLVALLLAVAPAMGQDQLGKFIDAGKEDASNLVKEYTSPFTKSLGYGLNNGWYNTAKPHSTLGFDLTISTNLVFVPSSAQTFTFRNSDYENIQLKGSGTSAELPTLMGGKSSTDLSVKEGNNEISSFRSPSGIKDDIKVNFLPVPVYNVGIGIIKNTEVKFRFMPTVKLGDAGEVKMFGLGLMHDVKQWIPGVKLLPFDLSLFGGYSKLTYGVDLSERVNGVEYEGEGVFETKAMTVQALISKKISVLTLYAGVGYNSIKSDINVNGEFAVEGSSTVYHDPVSIEVKESGFRATGGLRLKFAIFTIHGDYTLSKYPVASAGIGFSFR